MRTIGANLQTHLDTLQTTVCFLLKIDPQTRAAFGVTSEAQDITYNDGGGSLVYSSATGANLSAVETSANLSVNNAEAMLLIGSDISKADIAAGVLDYADFYLYRVNWADTSQGHYLVQSGRTGIVRSHDDLAAVLELRGLSQQLKQNYNDLYSITCRARFGSQVGEEMFPCGFDADSLLQLLGVGAVGTETDREFTADGTPSATGPNGALSFATAQLTFITGNNAGLSVETETVNGAGITLRFPAPYPIEVGDTFSIRPDCQKRYAEDCIAQYDNGLSFRGEPLIPITEEAPGSTPGASIPGLGAAGATPDQIPDDSPTPPDTPPDLTGAVSWESFFGKPFGSVICDATRVIPSEGIAIWFQVPDTTDVVSVGFSSVEVTGGITTTVDGAVNVGVLDFTTAPTYTWGIGGGIDGAINNIGSADIDLVPGNIYIFNARNNSVNDPNWRRLQVSYNVA